MPIGARKSIGCEDVVDLRLTRLLSGVHVFSIFAEVGMRTTKFTKTGRRARRLRRVVRGLGRAFLYLSIYLAPPFTALGGRFRLSCRCGGFLRLSAHVWLVPVI